MIINLLLSCGISMCLVLGGCEQRATPPRTSQTKEASKARLTEAEVKQRIVTGMSKEAVVQAFGRPDLEDNLEDGTILLTYLLPTEEDLRPRDFEFDGFNVFLNAGKVVDWSPIHSSTVIQEPLKDSDSPKAGKRDQPRQRQPLLSFYVIQAVTNSNYKYIDTDLLPKLGYVSPEPNLSIGRLKSVSYGKMRRAKRDDVTGETQELSRPTVTFQIQQAEAEAFQKLTEEHAGKRLLLTIDDFPFAAPSILHPIDAPGITIEFTDETQFAKAKPHLERLSAAAEK